MNEKCHCERDAIVMFRGEPRCEKCMTELMQEEED